MLIFVEQRAAFHWQLMLGAMEPASTQHSGAAHTIQMWHNHSEVMFFCPTTGLLQARPLIKKRLRIAEEKEKTMKKNRKDDRERYRLRNIWTVYCENIPTCETKLKKRVNLICVPLILCVTESLTELSLVQNTIMDTNQKAKSIQKQSKPEVAKESMGYWIFSAHR